MVPLLSIIVPYYNVEDYIEECLNSLVAQTIGIDNIEVILVDDCSTDRSTDLVNQYIERFPTMYVIKQEHNAGTGEARNTGIKAAKADHITFLDADDYVSSNMAEHVLQLLQQGDCELVLYEYTYFSVSGRSYARNPSAALFASNRSVTDITAVPEIIFATSVCNKVFHRKLLGSFPDSHIEDVLVSTLAVFHAKRIEITNGCTYYYRKREESGKSKTDAYYVKKQHYYDHLTVNLEMKKLLHTFPQYKLLIDWFNVRSIQPFLYRMTFNASFSRQEKIHYYDQVKQLVQNIDDQTINRIEHEQSRFVIQAAKRRRFLSFQAEILMRMARTRIVRVLQLGRKTMKLADFALAFLISYLYRLHPHYREVWLVCERGDEARDNGYWFFKFLREQKKQVHAFYLIDKRGSSDYMRIKELGNIVQYKSLKHKILFILASKLITAHKGTIEPWNYDMYKKVSRRFNQRQHYIFLQHGITKDNVSSTLGKENAPFDLFITAGHPEHNYIVSSFGYRQNEVKNTGFARFDALMDFRTEKQLLLMPTWRKAISWKPSEADQERVFAESDYYARYQSLITNEQLLRWLEANEYTLIFYPHYEMQKFLTGFRTDSDRVIIASKEQYDVQALLKSTSLLITDYSSVFFDFAYMGKPMVYYQFDEEAFFNSHYTKGYFDYRRDGFGPVVTNEEEVVSYIAEAANHSRMNDEYSARADLFFNKRDRGNCLRIYEAITELE
ncbi:CDP-glycerol glycerophosphotransferase family protein [Paenibacillus sp. R14(2021)]|uniref:bifunctional glycosyltransferase/CDP-glycerol:glycerophosphate glycerophosphotransferase n=1 Tax=Paenibacillus sp. R14(2021) TaxID=2859228 RepID=UPI001C612B48|nr:CDP-glycerol glycerophosphotransferase family protein [Paenibacillus sp. R14(2021)]